MIFAFVNFPTPLYTLEMNCDPKQIPQESQSPTGEAPLNTVLGN